MNKSQFQLKKKCPKIPAYQNLGSGVRLGKNVKIFGLVNLYGCTIGEGSKIGCFVEIQKKVRVGRRCKISSHSFLCEGVTLEDRVFIGHGVMFTNDKYPRATREDGALKSESDWQCERTRVREGASIGSGATILSGITIGRGAMIGAGSVVTRDIPDGAVACGNPARVLSIRSGRPVDRISVKKTTGLCPVPEGA